MYWPVIVAHSRIYKIYLWSPIECLKNSTKREGRTNDQNCSCFFFLVLLMQVYNSWVYILHNVQHTSFRLLSYCKGKFVIYEFIFYIQLDIHIFSFSCTVNARVFFFESIFYIQFTIFSAECGDSSSADLIACPSPSARGEFFCISEEYLCDKRMDCPNGEDEDLVSCMFHQWVSLSVASHTLSLLVKLSFES